LKVEQWLPPWDNPRNKDKPLKRKESLMEVNTKKRRNARRVFEEIYGWLPTCDQPGSSAKREKN